MFPKNKRTSDRRKQSVALNAFYGQLKFTKNLATIFV